MTDCGVCIGVDQLDDTFAESGRTVKPARRNHVCYECGDEIKKGDSHEHAAGREEYWGDAVSQNDWLFYHTCLTCVEIRDIFSCGNSYYYGCLWSEMEEYVFPELTTANKCFQKLSAGAKEFLLGRWRKWKGLR